MQNSGVIYHMESLLEMQFCCVMSILILDPVKKLDLKNSAVLKDNSMDIILVLILEHIFSYLCGFYRKWEISKYGTLDVNGVYRAPKEYML